MRVIFRVDSGTNIGTGHLMRCMTLADTLREKSVDVRFVCRRLVGDVSDLPVKKGYKVYRIAPVTSMDTDAELFKGILARERISIDWLVVDNYGLDRNWEIQIRPFVKKIMVIDDLANRLHDCDMLLDQNYFPNFETRYEKLVPKKCRNLCGLRYLLLRNEFYKVRDNLRLRDGKIKKVLIFFGGTDPSAETLKTLKAVELLRNSDIRFDVVVGRSNSKRQEVENACLKIKNAKSYCQVENMAELMASSDLCIGAGGTSIWERCFLGLPSIVVVIADNQKQITKSLSDLGVVWSTGTNDQTCVPDILNLFKIAIDNPEKLKQMADKSLNLTRESFFGKQEIIEEMFNLDAAKICQ